MIKLLKNKNVLISFVACIFAVLLLLSTLNLGMAKPNSNTANAESTSNAYQTNQNFTISLFDRNTGEESTSYSVVNRPFGKCFIYQWADINIIKFNYNPEVGENPPKKYEDEYKPETEYYDLSISIEYLQAYRDVTLFYQPDYKNIENAFTTKAVGINSFNTLKNLPESFAFYVDDGRTAFENDEAIRVHEWGIYRFKLLINDQETYSDFFIIEPTLEIKKNKIPEISFTPTSSSSSLHNDYIFSITNLEEYRYIDSSRLVWYVTGEGEDGILYILTSEDVSKEQFREFQYNALYTDYNNKSRTGLSFRFDDKGTSGSWEVWCEYQYYGSTDEPLKSKVIKLNTGSQLSYALILGVISGVSIIAIILAIIFGVKRAKKDKIY